MEVLVIPLPSIDFNSGFFGCHTSATSCFLLIHTLTQLYACHDHIRISSHAGIIKSQTYYNVTNNIQIAERKEKHNRSTLNEHSGFKQSNVQILPGHLP